MGDLDNAFRDYQALTRLNPEYYFGFEGLGMHLMRLSRWLEAKDAFVEAYRRAVKMGASSDESMYALLAAICWLRGGSRQEARPLLDEALRKENRDSLEYRILRLYRDWAGDLDIANRADSEKNPLVRSRMLFYLAWYYEIRGSKSLAEKLFIQVRDLEVKDIMEWRLNEWILNAR
jgi:tetratricopeptide (TPR) repeat protein